MSGTEYYHQILGIAEDYLGPAAGRFVNRQISTHLRKPPSELQEKDIQMLAVRIRSGLVVLTQDQTTVEEAFQRIMAVAKAGMQSRIDNK